MPSKVSEEKELLSCPFYISWKKRLIKNGCKILKSHTLGKVQIKNGFILRRLISVDFISPDNIKFSRNILLKDDGVVIIPFYYINSSINFVVVEQRRIIDGGNSYEFPSGGVIEGIGKSQSAVIELEEETGIKIDKSRLEKLADDILVCESSMSEIVTCYCVELNPEEIPKSDYNFGVVAENERTKVTFMSLVEIQRINSFHMFSALEILRRNGKLK